jgi:hypothetical protein
MAEGDQLPAGEREALEKRLARFERPFQFSLGKLMLWVAGFAVVCGLLASLWKATEPAREAARASNCIGRLAQLRVALCNYASVHGCFPPPYLCDNSGTPVHSWRVLILPFAEQQAAYARYDFSKPWDAAVNKRVATALSSGGAGAFQCPGAQTEGTPWTNYVAVVGPNTLWAPGKCTKLAEKNADKILLVEIVPSDIHWMEPRDLTLEEVLRFARGEPGPTISSGHPGGINCVMGDGACRTLDRDIDVETLRKMLTVEPEDSESSTNRLPAQETPSGQTQL